MVKGIDKARKWSHYVHKRRNEHIKNILPPED